MDRLGYSTWHLVSKPEPNNRLCWIKQPAETNRAISAEVLTLWVQPERGLMPPNYFISLAEDTGLILPIGRWVLETASSQLAS
jgi:EAL domain-containing protein (putative c-di-GMP-specific phosphodiesterase class I)